MPETDDGSDEATDGASVIASTGNTPITLIATMLHYVYVGRRARAEAEMVQRQPGLVEKLVAAQVASPFWYEDFGRTLFELMVPHDFKTQLRPRSSTCR